MIVGTRSGNWPNNPFIELTISPFNAFVALHRELDCLLSQRREEPGENYPTSSTAFGELSVKDNGSELTLTAIVPGLSAETLEVTLNAKHLTIRGVRKLETPEGFRNIARERKGQAFERTVALPTLVDSAQVEAKLSNGVLTVHLPKIAAAKPRNIEVKAT
jgi:HSP20 family protein